jgi:hypothetical protein
VSDEPMTPEIPVAAEPQPVEAMTEAKPRSRKGLLVAVGALVLLGIVAGIAAWLVLFVFSGVQDDVTVKVTPSKQNTGTPAAETPVAAGPAKAVSNDEVFTFRDIFKPLAGPAAADTGGSTDTSSGVDTSDYAADTLYLINILTDGETSTAVMIWNQQEYRLAEGDSIANTPWKVLEIRTDDVVMLYGDQQVVLSVGQGISK